MCLSHGRVYWGSKNIDDIDILAGKKHIGRKDETDLVKEK